MLSITLVLTSLDRLFLILKTLAALKKQVTLKRRSIVLILHLQLCSLVRAIEAKVGITMTGWGGV
jgi:hypothetical protein